TVPLDTTQHCVTCDLKERFPQLPATNSLAGIAINNITYESFITDPWFDQSSGTCVNPITGLPDTTAGECRNLWVGRVEIPVPVILYDWAGFFSPIDNDAINKAKAGSSIPIKFSLGGNMGLNIFEAGSPSSVVATSFDGVVIGENVVNETTGGSGLSYDPVTNLYIYVWKTQKSWAGTKRQLQVKLLDGTVHTANFAFTK
ncbi:MAG: PxKF domain-containing protein, partial [Desulfuromonadales bacterium]